MFPTKQPHYFELQAEQKKLFDEIYQLLTEFNSLMQVAKVAHSSELTQPFTTAYNFYNPLFANLQINFEDFKKSDFDYLTKLLIHLQGRFRSGMINKAITAYNVLIQIQKKLLLFTDNFKD